MSPPRTTFELCQPAQDHRDVLGGVPAFLDEVRKPGVLYRQRLANFGERAQRFGRGGNDKGMLARPSGARAAPAAAPFHLVHT
jgi:hypothetical protein